MNILIRKRCEQKFKRERVNIKLFAKLKHNICSCKEETQNICPHIYYPVEDISIGQSSSSFSIKGMGGSLYNTIHFNFYGENMRDVDVFKIKKYNTYL